nr:hypothetical protein [uncultured Azospirillum sp.]
MGRRPFDASTSSSGCAPRRPSVLRGLLAVLPLMAAVTGCASFKGYPERLPAEPAVVEQGSAAGILTCSDETCRNTKVAARMYAIDTNFSEFEEKLFQQMREAGFSTDVLTLGVTSAGAASGGAAASILSAIGAGITGSRAAFEKEVLGDKALPAIHSSMRASRARMRTRILTGLSKPLKDYPPGIALTDLEEYYSSGTVLSALIGITERAATAAHEAEQQLVSISGFASTDAANFLYGYAVADGLSDAEKRDRLNRIAAQYKAQGVDTRGIAAISLIRNPALASQTAAVARGFGWKG